jgi:hypothetical protein
MRRLLAFALALAAVAAPVGASAPTPPERPRLAPDDPCHDAFALDGAASCGGQPLCSPRERVAIACELRLAIETRYVFHGVKGSLLSAAGRPAFDERRHLDRCVAEERAIAREEDPLRFYDRMRRCTAAFEDGHLILSVPGGLSPVSLGIGLRLVADGTVRVANRAPDLVQRLKTAGLVDADALLAPGAEVVAIDGEPVQDVLAGLALYLPASSSAARLERAVDALTFRDFAYPRSPRAVLTLAGHGGRRDVELQWWIAPGAERNPLMARVVQGAGLRATELLDWSATPRSGPSDPAAGVARADTIFPFADARLLTEYRSEAGRVAARVGETSDGDGRRTCYAQLLTMHTETLAAGASAERRPFVDVLAAFVRGCGSRRLDLVLDLRENEGGYIAHSTALARLLSAPGAEGGRGALLLRANEHNERVFHERTPALAAIRAIWNGYRSEAEEILDAIRGARARGEAYATAFLDEPAGTEAGGYGGRVVALVSPACMSACDRLAAQLQAGGAVLVGGPTEGAGASQQEARATPARWTDSSGRLVVSIPTAAMGVARAGLHRQRTMSPAHFFSELALENRPVSPDVPYATSAEDLTDVNAGWRAAVDAALRSTQRVTAAIPTFGIQREGNMERRWIAWGAAVLLAGAAGCPRDQKAGGTGSAGSQQGTGSGAGQSGAGTSGGSTAGGSTGSSGSTSGSGGSGGATGSGSGAGRAGSSGGSTSGGTGSGSSSGR